MSGFSLKDQLFNRERVTYLADLFHGSDSSFAKEAFVKAVMKKLKKLELKQRIVLIAETLESHLSSEYSKAAAQIKAALPAPLDPTKTDDDFGDFIFAPLGEFVVRNGLTKRHLKLSLRTLQEITKRFSMEDAIRFFIREFPEQTMTELSKWSTHKNYHVRRLVSEGTRPTLPWSGRIGLEPEDTIPLLDHLHADSTRYVTRSVANHLNDLSKTESKTVVALLANWKKEERQDPKELDWITRHALRTLVKKGDPQALKLLGYRSSPKIQVGDLILKKDKIAAGEAIEFSVDIAADRAESLMVDYVIDFVKANGKTAPKVFKATKLQLKKSEQHTLAKKHPLRANATTFKLYPGVHRITIQINGKQYSSQEFELSVK